MVTISSTRVIDQVVVENGAVLMYTGGILTITDDVSGDDVIIKSGGVFTLAFTSNPPLFSPASATVNINTEGVLRVSATGLTFASPNPGVNTPNYIYQHAAVLEYTPNLAFASAGVTFFPNVNAATIPVFRTTGNLGLIGGNTATTFNGLFEANGNITFSSSGSKTFRNGIVGTGNIGSDLSCGKFIINGSTASLGGTGSLTLPSGGGLDIGNNTTVSMSSDKSFTGNISLLINALVLLGNNNLTITGDISGGSATSHIVTNGTGKLIINNIAGVIPRIFPVGASATTINPMAIYNGGGLHYGVRVELGINPGIVAPLRAVDRTWIVKPSGTPVFPVNVNFYYTNADGNASFNYAATVEHGFYTAAWNVINTGLTQSGGPVNFQVNTTVDIFAANIDAPMVIANLYAILAADNAVSVNYFTGIKQNKDHLLNWKLTCNSTPAVTLFLERSTDGISYREIFSEYATALRCEQPFTYRDDQPAAAVNFYRLKMIDVDGKTAYSPVVRLINAVGEINLLNIVPNPVTGGWLPVNISAAKNEQVEIGITDMQGRGLMKRSVLLIAGFNSIPLDVSHLARGTYQLSAKTAGGQAAILRFVIQ